MKRSLILIALIATAQHLPDPLLGVKTSRDWNSNRRPEILRLYEENVYGHTPKAPKPMRFKVLSEKKGELAIRKLVRLYLLGNPDGPWADLLLYIPAKAKAPVPAFLGMNYLGNQSVSNEPDIPITEAWIRNLGPIPGIVNNRATEGSRGAQVRRWPLETILRRGYAVATLCYAEVEPDDPDGAKTGLRQVLKSDWGAIGAWAFGLSRAMDYLQKDSSISAKQVVVTGHSRLGKTALWAGAQDQRFAIVISNDSGEGGASLARRKMGERIKDSFKNNGFWYTANYRKHIDHEDDLPVDAHFLIALSAPRPVYVSSATEDVGADPEGEFLAAKAASSVYRLFNKPGLDIEKFPAPDKSFGGTIGYHVRTGIHDILAADWEHHLNFADRHFGRAGR